MTGQDAVARAAAPMHWRRRLRLLDSDSEGQIKLLRACEVTTSGMQFDVVWQGHEHLPAWWQGLDEAVAVAALSEMECYQGKVIELELSTGTKSLCIIADVDDSVGWQLHAVDGSHLVVDARQCRLIVPT